MPDPLVAFLARQSLFAGIPRRRLARVLQISTPVRLGPGATVCREGAPGRQALLVVTGKLLVHRDGRPVAVLGAGELVGEIAVRRRVPRVASVTTLTPADALVFDPRELSELVRLDPALARRIDGNVDARLAGLLLASASRPAAAVSELIPSAG